MKIKNSSILEADGAKRRAPALTNKAAPRLKSVAAAFTGILITSVFALLPSSVEAQCAQWDASGKWELFQGTGKGYPINLQLSQAGGTITGTANYFKTHMGTTDGSVGGTITSSKIILQINWSDNVIGIYNGDISPQGQVEGVTYDKRTPSIRAAWLSKRIMKCTGPAPATPSTTPKPVLGIKHTGHTPVPLSPTPNPAATEFPIKTPPGTVAPTITASPSVVTIPAGQSQGTTTLSWDGGKNHPYAEIWVKVDDQDETKIVEQGKGSRQVKVAPGKTYLYILTDSGQRLAIVTVKTNRP
jgi:hypothetical protein